MRIILAPLLITASALGSAQSRVSDVVYMKSGGVAFTMDVVKPATPNKAAVIFVVSGGWISDHSMITSFMPDIEKVFVDAGFTVFEVLHGAQPRYKVAEMVEEVEAATRFVHSHAADYGVDPNRLGISGISSGGHLALMAAGATDTPVKAVAAISPPTDLANWGTAGSLLIDAPQMSMFNPTLEIDTKAPKELMVAALKKNSPILHVNAKYPPTLLVHGDSDQVVPLQQSKIMFDALTKIGRENRLEVVAGGGHDEKTFAPGLQKAVQWFKDKLLN